MVRYCYVNVDIQDKVSAALFDTMNFLEVSRGTKVVLMYYCSPKTFQTFEKLQRLKDVIVIRKDMRSFPANCEEWEGLVIHQFVLYEDDTQRKITGEQLKKTSGLMSLYFKDPNEYESDLREGCEDGNFITAERENPAIHNSYKNIFSSWLESYERDIDTYDKGTFALVSVDCGVDTQARHVCLTNQNILVTGPYLQRRQYMEYMIKSFAPTFSKDNVSLLVSRFGGLENAPSCTLVSDTEAIANIHMAYNIYVRRLRDHDKMYKPVYLFVGDFEDLLTLEKSVVATLIDRGPIVNVFVVLGVGTKELSEYCYENELQGYIATIMVEHPCNGLNIVTRSNMKLGIDCIINDGGKVYCASVPKGGC